jgi:hypothetical protein
MSREIAVQFVGFESKATVREYTFSVREPAMEPREFTLTIENEAFNAHRVRYQDAPDVCSLKLRRELATYSNHPPDTHFHITDIDLDDYRSAHTTRAAAPWLRRKEKEDF